MTLRSPSPRTKHRNVVLQVPKTKRSGFLGIKYKRQDLEAARGRSLTELQSHRALIIQNSRRLQSSKVMCPNWGSRARPPLIIYEVQPSSKLAVQFLNGRVVTCNIGEITSDPSARKLLTTKISISSAIHLAFGMRKAWRRKANAPSPPLEIWWKFIWCTVRYSFLHAITMRASMSVRKLDYNECFIRNASTQACIIWMGQRRMYENDVLFLLHSFLLSGTFLKQRLYRIT